MAKEEVQDTSDYKVGKDGRKIKAHRIIFNKGDDDGKKGITEMKKTYKAFVEQYTAELTEEQKDEIVAELEEALSGDLSAGEWIRDFVHSDNPKFEGKSKDKRKQMALAAYYAKQRNEGIEIDEASPIFHAIRANTLSHVTGFGRRSDDAAERHHARMQDAADRDHARMQAHHDQAAERHHDLMRATNAITIARQKSNLKKHKQDNSVKKEDVMTEGRRDAVLVTNAKNMDDNDVHVTTLRKAGLHASQGAGAKNHIIVPPEHEKKARELLSKHLKEDAENIDEKITIDGKGNRVDNHIKFQPHDAASKTDASVRAYYAKLKAERDKKKQEAPVKEELKGNQHKLDKNKNGKLDKHDFKLLRKEDAEQIEEAIHADDYTATSEKSQFGGHRPHVVNKETGKTMHLSASSYKSPEHAKAHAKAYLSAYAKTGMHAADRAAQDYAKANKDKQVSRKEEVEHMEESAFDWKNKPRQTSDSGKTKTYHDVKKVSTGTVYTKQFDKDGVSKGTGDDAAKKAEGAAKRGRGRPKKDKFAEAVEFLLALSEEHFDDMMEEGFDAFIESFEQLDELSKTTLGSYARKAAASAVSHTAKAQHSTAQAQDARNRAKDPKLAFARSGNETIAKSQADRAVKSNVKAGKRLSGVSKAIDRLTK
jgi:hypothetical protein